MSCPRLPFALRPLALLAHRLYACLPLPNKPALPPQRHTLPAVPKKPLMKQPKPVAALMLKPSSP